MGHGQSHGDSFRVDSSYRLTHALPQVQKPDSDAATSRLYSGLACPTLGPSESMTGYGTSGLFNDGQPLNVPAGGPPHVGLPELN